MVFSCEFCEISKNIYFTEHLWITASSNSTMQSRWGNKNDILSNILDKYI